MPAVGEAVILIPGFMGSRLVRRDDGRLVWLDPEWLLTHLGEAIDALRLTTPDDPRLAADGILENVPVGPFHPQVYGPLLDFLVDRDAGPGYEARHVRRFAYDWRKPVDEAAYELDSLIGRWSLEYRSPRPFVLLAHSYGGLVAAHALLTGNHAAARTALLVTFGVPFAGAVKTLASIADAAELDHLPLPGASLASLLGDWPASYDLMPHDARTSLVLDARRRPAAAADAGIRQDGFVERLAEESRARLSPHAEGPLPVPVRAIFAAGVETAVQAQVKPSGRYAVVKGREGDGTVPIESAVSFASAAPNGRRLYPVPFGHHVALVKDPVAFRYLRTELKYGTAERYVALATVRAARLPAGDRNEAIVELRDGDGNGLLGSFPPSIDFSPRVPFEVEPSLEPAARAYVTFAMPRRPVRLTVRFPGLPRNVQPAPILLAPVP